VSVVSKKYGRLSSPLAKGGLRGVVLSGEYLPQPLLGKEGGKRSKAPCGKSNELYGTGTGAVFHQSRNFYFVRVGLQRGRI
jgi:hypothetical protein